MNKAILIAVGASAFIAATSAASAVGAREIETDAKWQHKRECFVSQRVPARLLNNTRGVLVEDASVEWKGNAHKNGSRVVRVERDPVYITTTVEIEPQHVTLVPIRCR